MVSLIRCTRKAAPWMATLTVQSAVLIVPGLLWYILGSRRVCVPGTRISLHPSHNPYPAAALLFLFLGLAFASVQYLNSEQRRKAELEATALTPESIIGEAAVMQQQDQAWPVDFGQGIPQDDASSLPVDRTMQQPRGENFQRQGTEDLFRSIRDLKQKLYGNNADVTIKGQRDLATAAAEVDRLCSALGISTTQEGSRTARSLREKLAALRAEVG
ncbi:hypothetical protein WJX77_011113 [Trebouxia sp. C0004]